MVAWAGLVILLGCMITAVIWDILGDSTSLVDFLIYSSLSISFIVLMGLDVEPVRVATRKAIDAVLDYLKITTIMYTCFKFRSRNAPYIEVDTYQLLGVATLAILIIVVAVPIVWWAVTWVKLLAVASVNKEARTELLEVTSSVKEIAMESYLMSLLKKDFGTFFRRDSFTAKWGYILLIMCLLLIPAVIYSDFTPESTSANLNALYFSIVGSLAMIGMGNGKSYRYIPALKARFGLSGRIC